MTPKKWRIKSVNLERIENAKCVKSAESDFITDTLNHPQFLSLENDMGLTFQ